MCARHKVIQGNLWNQYAEKIIILLFADNQGLLNRSLPRIDVTLQDSSKLRMREVLGMKALEQMEYDTFWKEVDFKLFFKLS